MAIQPGYILIYDRLLPENHADGACIAYIFILGSDLVIDLQPQHLWTTGLIHTIGLSLAQLY